MMLVSLQEMQTKPEGWVDEVDQAKSVMERILSDDTYDIEQRQTVRRYEEAVVN